MRLTDKHLNIKYHCICSVVPSKATLTPNETLFTFTLINENFFFVMKYFVKYYIGLMHWRVGKVRYFYLDIFQ